MAIKCKICSKQVESSCACHKGQCYDHAHPRFKNGCDYESCGMPVFATENMTGTNMKLCVEHFKQLFGKLIKNAKIEDKTE